MNINKFTQKSLEAVQKCEKLAYEYGNQQIEPVSYTHLDVYKRQVRLLRIPMRWKTIPHKYTSKRPILILAWRWKVPK